MPMTTAYSLPTCACPAVPSVKCINFNKVLLPVPGSQQNLCLVLLWNSTNARQVAYSRPNSDKKCTKSIPSRRKGEVLSASWGVFGSAGTVDTRWDPPSAVCCVIFSIVSTTVARVILKHGSGCQVG